ncbi:hypothetical protein WMF04_01130 [Sorangium sp. So ce260]|uniref:hypothetical protein n=1 Tax=Sorangium sp. So ce260 TaxID=3133291 RepID=UPI003F5E5607
MGQRGEEGAGSAMLDGFVRAAEARDLPGVLELYRDLHPEDAPFPPEPELSALWTRSSSSLRRPAFWRARAPAARTSSPHDPELPHDGEEEVGS